MKYKKEDLVKLSWNDFDNYTNKIKREVENYLNENNLKIDIIAPILRGGGIPALKFSFEFKVVRILPYQYKYFPGENDFEPKKIYNSDSSQLTNFRKKNPTILVVEGNHSSGKIANNVVSHIKKTPFVYHTLKCVVCFGFSGCSEIKTPRLHPLTKVSGLISDIKEKLPNSKIIYVALAKDYFYKDFVKNVDFTTCGYYTNENRKLSKEECKKLGISFKNVYLFPWESCEEELAMLNNTEFRYVGQEDF